MSAAADAAPNVDGQAVEERVCPECGETYAVRAPNQTLCGKRVCKRRRERRRARERETPLREREEFKALEPKQTQSLVADVVKEELRPIVREKLTGHVLEGIDALVSLLPQAVEQLEQDMRQGDDPELAHKAAALVMKLTVQNNSVAPPAIEEKQAPLQVHFNVPRAGDQNDPASDRFLDEVPDAEVVDEVERECMECHVWKPDGQFVGQSDRCITCDAELKARVLERFGPRT
jgi:hypothetical protein